MILKFHSFSHEFMNSYNFSGIFYEILFNEFIWNPWINEEITFYAWIHMIQI